MTKTSFERDEILDRFGDTWVVQGTGRVSECGRHQFLHLRSTTRGWQQKNGWTGAGQARWVAFNPEHQDEADNLPRF